MAVLYIKHAAVGAEHVIMTASETRAKRCLYWVFNVARVLLLQLFWLDEGLE